MNLQQVASSATRRLFSSTVSKSVAGSSSLHLPFESVFGASATPTINLNHNRYHNPNDPHRRHYTTHSQLPEEHQMIYDMCRKFADEELAPNAGKWDKEHSFPKDAVSQLVRRQFETVFCCHHYCCICICICCCYCICYRILQLIRTIFEN